MAILVAGLLVSASLLVGLTDVAMPLAPSVVAAGELVAAAALGALLLLSLVTGQGRK